MRQGEFKPSLTALSWTSCVFSVALLGLVSCSGPAEEGKLLATIPKGFSEPDGGWRVAFSPDLSKVAYRAQKDGKMFVVTGDKPGRSFDKVFYPQFSPNGSKLAYVAEEGGKKLMVVNEKPGPAFQTLGYATFSPDSRRVAYRAREASGWGVVVDDKSIGGDFFMVDQPLFTPDSAEIVYVATMGPAFRSGRMVFGAITLFVGERRVAAHEGLKDPAFSPDGNKLAYVKIEGLLAGHPRYSVVVDGKEGPRFDGFDAASEPVFSPDGNVVAHLARGGERSFVVVGDRQGPKFDEVSRFVFGPTAGHFAYAGKTGEKWAIIIGQTVGPAFDEVKTPVFSPGGEKVAYGARLGNKWRIVVGAKQGPDSDEVGDPVFGADSKTIQYGAREGRRLLVKTMTVQ